MSTGFFLPPILVVNHTHKSSNEDGDSPSPTIMCILHVYIYIYSNAVEYKGHIEVQCSDTCCISYHSSCWRRFKGVHVVGGDKDFLGMLCPTPDCGGLIRVITIFNSMNKVKTKVGKVWSVLCVTSSSTQCTVHKM